MGNPTPNQMPETQFVPSAPEHKGIGSGDTRSAESSANRHLREPLDREDLLKGKGLDVRRGPDDKIISRTFDLGGKVVELSEAEYLAIMQGI